MTTPDPQPRLSVNMSPAIAAELGRIMNATGMSATDTVRHAISDLGWIVDILARGAEVMVNEPDGTTYVARFTELRVARTS